MEDTWTSKAGLGDKMYSQCDSEGEVSSCDSSLEGLDADETRRETSLTPSNLQGPRWQVSVSLSASEPGSAAVLLRCRAWSCVMGYLPVITTFW